MPPFVLLLVVLCALSTAGGLLVVRRAMRALEPGDGEETGLVRVRARVATGSEQTLVGLVRELHVPRGADCASYGDLYLQPGAADGLVVRTVSPLDRGLVAPLTFRRAAGCTEVVYAIVQLPKDDALHAVALEFEARLVSALRRLDPACEVRLAGTTLRDLDDTVWRGPSARPRAARRRTLLERLPVGAQPRGHQPLGRHGAP